MRPTPISYGGQIVAVIDDDHAYLSPVVKGLEPDDPRRRFVCMKALVAREMQVEPGSEPYDDDLAEFYTRSALISDDEFVRLDDGRTDARLAEHFNVPVEQIAAKRYDLAFLRRPPRRGPASR